MDNNTIAILLGAAAIAVLVIHRIVEKRKQAKFRQELIDKYKGESR